MLTPRLFFTTTFALFTLPFAYGEDISSKGGLLMKVTSISQYQKAGDYVQALSLAKKNHERSNIINHLENSVLTLGYSRLFFDENYKPRLTLITLLDIVGMKNPQELGLINDWAQKNLLRQGERWEEQTQSFEKLKPQIEPLLVELGFISDVPAHFQTYEGAILHGAFLSRTRIRLEYLVKQWQEGVRFSDVYFLTGSRPLDPKEENKEALLKQIGSLKIRKDWLPPSEFPKTEAEMMEFIWEQSELPEDMRAQVKVTCVNVPMRKDSKTEKLIRPTTDDTIELWLKSNPPTGRYLVISMAPYVPRQDVVMRTMAPRNYGFDTIGPGLTSQESMAIILDEVARLIFQTKQLAEKKR